jgi:hypothetical protein
MTTLRFLPKRVSSTKLHDPRNLRPHPLPRNSWILEVASPYQNHLLLERRGGRLLNSQNETFAEYFAESFLERALGIYMIVKITECQ